MESQKIVHIATSIENDETVQFEASNMDPFLFNFRRSHQSTHYPMSVLYVPVDSIAGYSTRTLTSCFAFFI